MEVFLIYILKSAGLLSIFYLAYFLLLKNDTSFELNRKFLMGGIFASIVLPAVYFTKKVVVEMETIPDMEGNSSLPMTAVEQGTDWWMITGVIYSIVLFIMLLRFILHVYRVASLIYSLPKQMSGKFTLVRHNAETGPFSFFRYIVFNPNMHTEKELELILKHEMVHAGQFHTFDILMSNLLSCFLWFNPLCLLYKKSIEQNLEFIADRDTVEEFASKKEYLQTLVKVSLGNLQPALSNSFYKSFIKKRILMLNKNTTSTGQLWKISLVFPAILAFMLVFNVQTKIYAQEKTTIISTAMEVFIDFDKNTTREDLDGYISLMAEYDVILKFNNIKYNSEGILTNITVEFIDKSNVASGSVTKSNSAGIVPFRYVYNPEEGSRFTSAGVQAAGNPKSANQNIRKMVFKTSPEDSTKISFDTANPESEPIYILNGKVVKNASSVKAIDPNNISSINVLKGQSAVSLYGDAAKDGAIIITTKAQGDSSSIKNFTFTNPRRTMPDSLGSNRTFTINKMRTSRTFVAGEEIFFPQETSPENRRSLIITNNKSNYYETPLVIVDGEEKPADFNITSVDNSDIKNINVLKGETAVKKYGEKAKGGVVEITLKKKK